MLHLASIFFFDLFWRAQKVSGVPTNKSRVTINLEPHVAAALKVRANLDGRSVANYVMRLVNSDVGVDPSVGEDPGNYGGAGISDVAKAVLDQKQAATPKRRKKTGSGEPTRAPNAAPRPPS